MAFTVAVTSDPTGVPVGSLAYGIEYENVALFVKPADIDSDLIICAKKGDLPTTDGRYQFVHIPDSHPDWNPWDNKMLGDVLTGCNKYSI